MRVLLRDDMAWRRAPFPTQEGKPCCWISSPMSMTRNEQLAAGFYQLTSADWRSYRDVSRHAKRDIHLFTSRVRYASKIILKNIALKINYQVTYYNN